MVLAFDVGNTNIVLGGLENGKKIFCARLATDTRRTSYQYALEIEGILKLHNCPIKAVSGSIISTVVPYFANVLPEAVKLLTGIDTTVVTNRTDTGLRILTDTPEKLGADLIVSAVAARAKYQAPMAIIDMGTATTVSILDAKGDFIGYIIAPGLQISMKALSSNAAQLPYIDLSQPARLIGTNTTDSMRSGALIGSAAMLDGLADRIEKELKAPVSLILTGGISSQIATYLEHDVYLEPDIILDGLWIIYERSNHID